MQASENKNEYSLGFNSVSGNNVVIDWGPRTVVGLWCLRSKMGNRLDVDSGLGALTHPALPSTPDPAWQPKRVLPPYTV